MRLQLALNVDDLDASVEFYEKMFDTTAVSYTHLTLPTILLV